MTILLYAVCVPIVAIPTAATAPLGFEAEPKRTKSSESEVPSKSPVPQVIVVTKGVSYPLLIAFVG